MSTTATTAAAAVDKPPRRFPPPCWTQDEALALIQSYRDRWYALRRGYLRTADWDAVAENVGRLCPGAIPPKTSAQCRHKMEKLRQRYRAEKQRALSFPGPRFLSTWFYFEAMDSMERNGTGSDRSDGFTDRSNGSDGFIHGGEETNAGSVTNMVTDPVYPGLNPGRGIRFKPVPGPPVAVATGGQLVTVASRANNVRVSHGYTAQEEDNDDEFELENQYYSGKMHRLSSQDVGNYQSYQNIEQHSGIRPRKISKVGLNFNHNHGTHGYWNENGGDDDVGEDDDDVYNERINNRGLGREGEFSRGVKRDKDDSIGQIVASIKLLADGFVKMERMKMDMVHEIEKSRMEAEMRRNKMLLESQKQIVEAFVKGLAESKR
ncbi:putative transcription factor MYB family [Helianthus debilis subsp. tardiflorus]